MKFRNERILNIIYLYTANRVRTARRDGARSSS
jgi:hypothetical protein